MENFSKIITWKITHKEKLIYNTNKGNPIIYLKFFSYPNYRQNVKIVKFPNQCKIKNKGLNSFFIFNHMVGSKGIISLERSYLLTPQPSFINHMDDWGLISDITFHNIKKYKQKLKYWSIKPEYINEISKQDWFKIDNLSDWVKSAYKYIKKIIKYPEKQEKRLGSNKTLQIRIGDCDEFTDIFITISRIRGIPCRRLTGYFIWNNGITCEPHAWGEIFSQNKGWVNVDIALNNIGFHSENYIILKIEEFNSSLSDFLIQTKHSSTVNYKWELPNPIFSPIFY